MKPISFLIKKYILVNKKQYFKISFAYFLCFMLIVCQIFFVIGYINESKENTLETYGTQDGILVNCSNSLNSDYVSSYGDFYIFGNSQNDKYVYNNMLTIGYADEQAFQINHITLLNGNMPLHDNEVVIEESVNSVLRDTLKVGDKINLNIAFLENSGEYNSIEKNVEFIISGIIKNYSKTQWNLESDSCLPNIIVSKEYFKDNVSKSINIKSVLLNINPSDFFNDNLIEKGICSEYFVNSHHYVGVEKSLSYICIGIIVLTTLFSFAIIFTIHSLLKNDEQNKTGLFQSIGMNNAEIYKYFLSIQLIYILTGIVVTVIVSPIILHIVKVKLFVETPFKTFEIIYFILALILISIISILFTYLSTKKHLAFTSIENININSNEEASAKINIKAKNPALLWALKNYIANPSRFSAVSIMTVTLVLLSILGGASINFVKNSTDNAFPSDVVVSAYDGSFNSELQIPTNPFYGIEHNDLKYIEESDDIKRLIPLTNLQVNYICSNENNANGTDLDLWNSESYKEALAEYGYNDDLKLKSTNLFSTNSQSLEALKKAENIEGQINISKLNEGEEIVICKATKQYDNFNVGDTVEFTQIIYNGSKYEKLYFKSTVGAIVTFTEAESNSFIEDVFGDRIVWGDQAFQKLGINLNSNLLYIQLNDYEEYSDLDIRLNSIIDNYYSDLVSVDMFFEQSALQHSLLNIIETIVVISSFLISVTIFISLYVQYTIRLREQKNIFSAMRAVGMDFHNLYAIFFFENIIQFTVSILIGGGCGLIILLLLKYQLWLYDLISLNFPLFILSISILVLFLLISPILPLKQFLSKSILDNTRDA